MHKSTFRIIIVFSSLALAALACNLPALSAQSDETEAPAQQDQQPIEADQATHAPTQVLPRPTRPEGESQLPKPTIPAPPAQTTREPQAQIATQPAQPPQENPPSEGTDSFFIVNDTSSLVICYFYMTFSSETEWGEDRLGESDVIYPGETYTLTDVPFGIFDAQALDCDGALLAEVYGFDFPTNDTFTLYE